MKWAVEIQSTALEPRLLTDLLTPLGFCVIETPQGLVFTSDEMNDCDTASEAFKLAQRLRHAMRGPARIDAEFRIGSVVDFSCDPPRRIHCLEGQSIVAGAAFMASAKLSLGPPKGLPERELKVCEEHRVEREYQVLVERLLGTLVPAYRCKRAAEVLELLSQNDPSGETVYKIYELAEGHPTNREKFHRQFGISQQEFKRFTDAVHNPAVSGDWARHAYGNPPKSDRPMSRSEATAFVRNIANRWLESVRRSECP